MTLESGRRLGPYEILGALGAGGMGEVYRARDERLRPDIALKVLPASFSNDAERLARFEREAQLLASLNHPNVGTIHGFEEAEGVRFLVLELVPGQTLAEQLAEGPMVSPAIGRSRFATSSWAAASCPPTTWRSSTWGSARTKKPSRRSRKRTRSAPPGWPT